MARNRKLLKVHRQRSPDGTIRETYYTSYRDPATGAARRKYLGTTEAEALQALIGWHDQSLSQLRSIRTGWEKMAETADQLKALEAALVLPPVPADDQPQQPDRPSNGKRVSDCLSYWTDWKRETDGRSAIYLATTGRNFKAFQKTIGNKPVDKLVKDDFVRWERAARRLGKGKSGKWIRDALAAPATVFRLVKRKTDWPFPAGLMEWTESHDPIPYKPKADNRRALTPDEFGKLIAACREWATADPEQFPADTQTGRAMRLVASRKRREAALMETVCKLALYGFDRVDLEKLQWSDLHLDDDPYIDLPRTKCEWKTGAPVPRVIPLLPEQVEALKRWKPQSKGPFVFTSARGTPLPKNTFIDAFGKLATTAGVKTNFKHFRNIPGTVARNATLPDWLAQAVLGHTPTSVLGQHYCESPQPSALLPLVNLIGDAYFKTAGKKE